MELTSPGIDRNIKNAAEFELFVGRDVRVWSRKINDWLVGKIINSDKQSVTLEAEDGSSFSVPYEEIAKAKFI